MTFCSLYLIRISVAAICVYCLLGFHYAILRRVWLRLLCNHPLGSWRQQLDTPTGLSAPSQYWQIVLFHPRFRTLHLLNLVEIYEASVRPFLYVLMTSTSCNWKLPSSHWLLVLLLFYSFFSYLSSCLFFFCRLSCIFFLLIIILEFIFHFLFLYRLMGLLKVGFGWFATWLNCWNSVIHSGKEWGLTNVREKFPSTASCEYSQFMNSPQRRNYSLEKII